MGSDSIMTFEWGDYVTTELYATKPLVLTAPADSLDDVKRKPFKLVQLDTKYFDTN